MEILHYRTHLSLNIIFLLVLSCAGRHLQESYKPILGSWRTEKGIIMSIQISPYGDAVAIVKTAPGFITEDIQTGKAVINHIKPLVDGGFSGIFEMPDGLEPVTVKMGFTSHDTLLIITWDRRAKSKVMRWQRIRNSQ